MTTLMQCTAGRRPFALTCSAAGNAFAPGNNGTGARPHHADGLDFPLRLAYIVVSVNTKGEISLKSFTYLFEELPLVVSNGYSACEISGFAEITYDTRGAWSVGRIGFEAVKPPPAVETAATVPDRRQPGFQRISLWLETGDPIQLMIYHRLEHDWCARIQRQVDDRLFDDCDAMAEWSADHTIALWRELS